MLRRLELVRAESPTMRSELPSADHEAGFTLIELMVVLLIIAILLAIAIPTFLGVANSAGDRAAQSNLTNGLTEAKAIYQNSAEYATTAGGVNTILPTGTFTASAPEFSWVTGAAAAGGCFATSNANCVSEQIIDAGANTDAQGIILAVYSPKTQSCWYSVDLESNPVNLAADTGVPFKVSGTIAPTGASSAGVFYAVKKAAGTSGAAVSATTCNANWAATRAAFVWGQSYSSPGTAY